MLFHLKWECCTWVLFCWYGLWSSRGSSTRFGLACLLWLVVFILYISNLTFHSAGHHFKLTAAFFFSFSFPLHALSYRHLCLRVHTWMNMATILANFHRCNVMAIFRHSWLIISSEPHCLVIVYKMKNRWKHDCGIVKSRFCVSD